jgi:hypothetical protein
MLKYVSHNQAGFGSKELCSHRVTSIFALRRRCLPNDATCCLLPLPILAVPESCSSTHGASILIHPTLASHRGSRPCYAKLRLQSLVNLPQIIWDLTSQWKPQNWY